MCEWDEEKRDREGRWAKRKKKYSAIEEKSDTEKREEKERPLVRAGLVAKKKLRFKSRDVKALSL